MMATRETTENERLPARRRMATPAAAAAALRDAAARISSRRARDALPGRIETPRLVLRAPIRGDVPDLVRLLDNPRIHAVLPRLPRPYTRADAIAFVEIFAQRPDERAYAVTRADACIGIAGFSYAEGEAPELGYWLGEPYWGNGYMSETVRALLDAAFATGHYPRVRARALAGNAASLRVLAKAGFTPVHAPEDAATASVVLLSREQPRWM